jgi:hypothetical protein
MPRPSSAKAPGKTTGAAIKRKGAKTRRRKVPAWHRFDDTGPNFWFSPPAVCFSFAPPRLCALALIFPNSLLLVKKLTPGHYYCMFTIIRQAGGRLRPPRSLTYPPVGAAARLPADGSKARNHDQAPRLSSNAGQTPFWQTFPRAKVFGVRGHVRALQTFPGRVLAFSSSFFILPSSFVWLLKKFVEF